MVYVICGGPRTNVKPSLRLDSAMMRVERVICEEADRADKEKLHLNFAASGSIAPTMSHLGLGERGILIIEHWMLLTRTRSSSQEQVSKPARSI